MTVVVATVFILLALVHLYWALGGRIGKLAAVPHVGDRPAFIPSAVSTLAVAFGLAVCALLVAASGGLVVSSVPARWVTWLAVALAVALLARAVGDFRMVGFFKRIRGTRFARLDSTAYSPLCLALSIAIGYIAIASRAVA